ncbi:MAG TPA: rRNA maturation RNase YbeY [Longimicrobiaceae bacterium]|nr:rRNA maturation RNase YbeY [Longimicrobiaceae bacterium]
MDEIEVEVSFGEGVSGEAIAPERIERAVRHVLAAEGMERAEISVALVGDEEISDLNVDYLSHEGPTDVLSFALHEAGEPPLGDVYLGVDQAARQAGEFAAALDEELLRLAIHGTLHVLGYDHPAGAGRTRSRMFARQEELLRQVLAAERGA